MKNKCTLHNSIVLATVLPKRITVGGYLTKF